MLSVEQVLCFRMVLQIILIWKFYMPRICFLHKLCHSLFLGTRNPQSLAQQGNGSSPMTPQTLSPIGYFALWLLSTLFLEPCWTVIGIY